LQSEGGEVRAELEALKRKMQEELQSIMQSVDPADADMEPPTDEEVEALKSRVTAVLEEWKSLCMRSIYGRRKQ
jgi:HAMP domain-containing protein